MYMRWDGAVTTEGVYSYPILLTEGKDYTFKGKYGWNSVVPDGITESVITIGVNSTNDNNGTIVASNEYLVKSDELFQLHDAEFKFSVPATDLYFLTFSCNAAILAAISDLEIDGLTNLPKTSNNSALKVWSIGEKLIIQGTQPGDAICIYNTTGQIVKKSYATDELNSFKVNQGIYLVKVNNQVFKVMK